MLPPKYIHTLCRSVLLIKLKFHKKLKQLLKNTIIEKSTDRQCADGWLFRN